MWTIIFHELLHTFNVLYLLIDRIFFSAPYLLLLVVNVFENVVVIIFENINNIRTSCVFILMLLRNLLIVILINLFTHHSINYFSDGTFVFIFLDDGLGQLMLRLQNLIIIPFHQMVHIRFLLSNDLLYFLNLGRDLVLLNVVFTHFLSCFFLGF